MKIGNPLLEKAIIVAAQVREQGGWALLVGGFVRDMLLGLSPKDADMEIFGLQGEELYRLLRSLGQVNTVGESFRVYKLVWHQKVNGSKRRFELDVSLPRRDRRVGSGHRGFFIEGDPEMTVVEAARRRDFTINAILYDPLSEEILDPFHGREDLQHRVLRVVDPQHFGEDSLRVLRAVQFTARFQMKVDEDTVKLCRSIPLDDLPKERIWGEWQKMLLQAEAPSVGLRAADDLAVLDKLFPELQRAMSRRGEELCRAVDRAANEKEHLPYAKQVALMLAVLGIFLGWRGVKILMDRLNVHTIEKYDVRTNVIRLVGERKRVIDWYRHKDLVLDYKFRFLSARCEPALVYHLARTRGDVEAAKWFKYKMESLNVFKGPPRPLLMGRHLIEMGLKPGPLIGKITGAAWIEQLKGNIKTLEDALQFARKMIEAARIV